MSGGTKFVFCEGKDDVLVLNSLIKNMGLEIAVEQYDGKDNLANFLQEHSKRPMFARKQVPSMAVFRDADNNADGAFTSVRNALRENGFEAPEANETFKGSALRVGIFIIGVNGEGMIEDLCLQSVSDLPEFACVKTYFDCIAEKSDRKDFNSKAKVRVWMASHVNWEYYVGKAAEEGYWPWEKPTFDALKNFLRAL